MFSLSCARSHLGALLLSGSATCHDAKMSWLFLEVHHFLRSLNLINFWSCLRAIQIAFSLQGSFDWVTYATWISISFVRISASPGWWSWWGFLHPPILLNFVFHRFRNPVLLHFCPWSGKLLNGWSSSSRAMSYTCPLSHAHSHIVGNPKLINESDWHCSHLTRHCDRTGGIVYFLKKIGWLFWGNLGQKWN